MKTDFWVGGSHFLLLSQTAVNCYQQKQCFVYLEHTGSVEMRFLSFFINLFIPSFFLLVETIIDFRGKSILRRTILMLVDHINAFFSFFRYFFKVEVAFPYSGNVFINVLHVVSSNGFSAQWKQYFLVSTLFLLLETIIGIRKIATIQLIFWLVEIFFFSIFQRLLPVIDYLPSS